MWRTNSGAACLILAVLTPIFACILLSDWAFQRVSDGFRLGTFPLAYLVLSMALIGVMLLDDRHAERLSHLEELSIRGLLRVIAFIAAALALAFFQQRAGFVACACLLAATAVIAMGQRSPRVVMAFSIGAALLLFAVFYTLGLSITAGPQF